MTAKLGLAAVVGIVAAFEWRQFAEDGARVGALVAALGLIARTKPLRFVFRRVVTEPYWEAHGAKTRAAIDEVLAPVAAERDRVTRDLVAEVRVEVEAVRALVVEHDRKTDERAQWVKPSVATELWDGNDFPAGDIPPLQNPWEE